jgi:hypothetical protein
VTDWSTVAADDLQTMHDLIRDNHPGPVNTEDPTFNVWLRTGAAALRAQARAARTEHDYRLVLLTYANGFADGHVEVRFNVPERRLWPGFVTRIDASADDPSRVVLIEDAPGVRIGDVLAGCGTESAYELLTRRVLLPRLNPKVPHRLRLVSPWLTIVGADDIAGQASNCRLCTTTGVRTVELHWRPIDDASLSRLLIRASGIEVPKLGVRVIRGTWIISLPSFNCRGPDAARMRKLIASLRARASELHKARRVVFDLRGNCGGNSQWGEDIVAALWGAATANALKATFDLTVDWRVSRRNIDALRANAVIMREAGHPDGGAKSDALAQSMEQALAAEVPLMRETCAPAGTPARLQSPFENTVYVLTTPHCASACLDFLDWLDRLPGTKRIGLPTYADTKYLESAFAPLPSGLAKLVYPMKVYRNRAREADAAFHPEIAWSGATMTDESVVEWIDGLP